MLCGFLLGLILGLLCLLYDRVRLRKRLLRLRQDLNLRPTPLSLPVFTQLSMAIAAQQQNYHQLEQQVQREHAMLEQAPVSILHVDDENRLVWWNASAQALFNIHSGDYPRPRLLLELIRSYELDQLVEQVRQRGARYQQDWTFFPINADPSNVVKQRSYALRGYGIPLAVDHVGLFVENRQEIAILQQQRDRWTSDVAHELKTPLTSIRLIAETLQSRLDPALVGWADRLVNQSTRLSSLVRDLLDLSQLELDGAVSLPICAVNLAELIQAAWLNLEPIARKKNLQFTYIGPAQLMVKVDESRMYRVFINLFDNSIKYSPPRETVRVVVQALDAEPAGVENSGDRRETPMSNYGGDNTEDGAFLTIMDGTFGGMLSYSRRGLRRDRAAIPMVQIEVIDAGPGFLEDDLPHIFERFYRADEARTQPTETHRSSVSYPLLSEDSSFPPFSSMAPDTAVSAEASSAQPSGTGLGLAIVQQIVKAHGGYLDAQNHPQTGGAMIRIQLPKDGTAIL